MKTTFIMLLVAIFGLLAFIFIAVGEMNDRNRVQQKEIDHWKKVNKEQADSLNQVLKVTKDSLFIAFETIKQARIERETSHLRTQATIKTLQQIVYIKYESDSARLNAIKTLYPSWK